MISKCKYNSGHYLDSALFEKYYGWHDQMIFNELTIGRSYIIYAILKIENYKFYMICGDDYDGIYINYPQILPSELFEITNNNRSKYWIDSQKTHSNSNYRIGFKEFVEEEFFYGNLVEGYEREINIFQKWKSLIDEEYV